MTIAEPALALGRPQIEHLHEYSRSLQGTLKKYS